VKKILQSCQ
jgi:transposase